MDPCSYGVASHGLVCQSAPATADGGRFQHTQFVSKGAPGMGLRACLMAAVLIGSSLGSLQVAQAAEQSVLRRVSCTMVRFYVAKYSQGAAEAYARSKGATDAEIESARRCLKGTTIITAQNN